MQTSRNSSKQCLIINQRNPFAADLPIIEKKLYKADHNKIHSPEKYNNEKKIMKEIQAQQQIYNKHSMQRGGYSTTYKDTYIHNHKALNFLNKKLVDF